MPQRNTAIALRPETSSPLAVHGPQRQALSFDEIMKMAEVFYQAGLFENLKSAAEGAVKIQYGQELGIPPASSIAEVQVLFGKPTIGANAIIGKYSDHGYYIELSFDRDAAGRPVACWGELYDATDRKRAETGFSLEDAENAGITKRNKNWKTYREDMLRSRVVGRLWRMHRPSGLPAVWTTEEMRDAQWVERQSQQPHHVDTRATSRPSLPPAQTIRHLDARHHMDTVEVPAADYPEPLQGQAEEMRKEQAEEERKQQLRRLHAVGRDAGFDHDDLRSLVGVESLKEATGSQMAAVADSIDGWTDDQVAVAQRLLTATALDDLATAWSAVANGQKRELRACKDWRKGQLQRGSEAPGKARLYRPSNGSEGEHFMGAFCYRCAKFGDVDAPDNPPCQISLMTMTEKIQSPDYPQEWQYAEGGYPICTAFEREEAT